MVSPLQVWKHPEHKGLWPAVSGLAILTHLGILGFSLPYLIEIMQPAQGSKTAAIPVELIIEKGSAEISQPSPQQTSDSSAASTDSSEQSAEKAASAVTDQTDSQIATQADNPIETTVPAANKVLTSQADSTVASAPSQKRDVQTPASSEPANRNADQSTAKLGTSVDSDVASSNSRDLDSQNSDSQNSPDSINSNDEDTLPVLSGDRVIPTPGSEPAGSDLPQTAYLKIVSHSYVPRSLLQDITTTPPQPIYEEITAVELRPQDVNCERVDFSQSQVTYRITVNKDGSMRDASPWTGSIAERPPLNTEERAIACLLLASGFRFIPATSEGELVVNENLLLTIDLIESQPN